MRVSGYRAIAATIGVLLALPGLSQTPRAASRSAPPAGGVVQPEAFRRLADKARRLKGVRARGFGRVTSDRNVDLPPEMQRVGFRVWVLPPGARVSMDTPDRETRLSDGRHVYVLRCRPGARPEGRRRRLTEKGLYKLLAMAAVYRDAAEGYANLASAVRFVPTEAPAGEDRKGAELAWFRLEAAGRAAHHLLAGCESVIVGIDPADGLMRTMRSVRRIQEAGEAARRVEVAVVFEAVTHGQVSADDLRLPAAAAEAEWTDVDTGQTISPPAGIIVPAKP